MLAAIALIVFGPDKLPEVARSVGRFMSEMRRMASEVKSEFTAGIEDDDVETHEASADTVEDEDAVAIEEAASPSTPDDR